MSTANRYQLRRELYDSIQTSRFHTGQIVSVLAKISQSGDAFFIKDIIPLLWAKEDAVLFETVVTLSRLLQPVPVGSLPDLDSEIRSRWPHWMGLRNRDRTQMARLKRSPAWWWAFAVLASHPSGFVRQTAIEELALEEAGESLPFILLRTTDWVEPVRVLARDILHRKLDRVVASQLERCLPLVFRMRKGLRHQPLEVFEEIEKLAASRQDRTLADTYSGGSGAFLRYRFELSKKYSDSLDRVIDEAVSHSEVSPRLLACDWMADEAAPQEIRDRYGDSLLKDKSPLVRARAFWRIANADPNKWQPQIEVALMDPNASVQDTARGAWRMLLYNDALSFYRRRITEVSLPSAIVPALRGLRAESNVQDEAIVRPFLRHTSAKVRKEALRTLVNWNVSDTTNLLQDRLQSASPSDSKAAAALLVSRPDLLSASLVKELLAHPRHPDSYQVALRLLVKLPKWARLPLILLGYSISSCRERALIAFENWNKHYNRVQSMPSKTEASEAAKAFQTIAGTPLSKNRELLAIVSNLEKLS